MLQALIKALLSGAIVANVSETARRNPALGALIASLPLVSVLGMMWLWRETHDVARLSAHSSATFWYVLPSLPMFLIMPWMWNLGIGFWPGLTLGLTLTVVLYLGMTAILLRFGIAI